MAEQKPAAEHDVHLQSVLSEYLQQIDRGEQVNPADVIAAHPELADDLRQYFDAENKIQSMAGPTQQETFAPSTIDGAVVETMPPETDQSTETGASPGTHDKLPELFGRYRIIKTLGQGAMGAVYLAEDTDLGRQVALKVPKFSDIDSQEVLDRFYQEARSAATLHHRNICPVHDIGEYNGTRYITMAYIEGRPLSDYIKPDKPQQPRNIVLTVRKLALALQEAHERGVVHRDLKPANIMIDQKNEPVIMDFGLARQLETSNSVRLTQTGQILGSPAYMSPEQVEESASIGPVSDIYSLGVIFYELLTGQLPFKGSIAAVLGQIMSKDPTPLADLRPELDKELEQLCLQMLAKDASARPTSMKAVAQSLTKWLKKPQSYPSASKGETNVSGPIPKLEQTAKPVKADNKKNTKPTTKTVIDQPAEPATQSSMLTASSKAALFMTMKKCLAKHDYDQVLQLGLQLPVDQHTTEIDQLIAEAQEKSDEVGYLTITIEELLQKRDHQALLPKLKELLALKPGNRKAKQLLEKLGETGSGGIFDFGSGDHSFVSLFGSIFESTPTMIIVGVVTFGLMLGAITLYLKSGGHNVKITIDDPTAQVFVDDQEIRITGEAGTVTLDLGEHEVTVKNKQGVVYEGWDKHKFVVTKKGRKLLSINVLDEPAVTASGDANAPPPLAKAPFDAKQAKAHQKAWADYLGEPVEKNIVIGKNEQGRDVVLTMVLIPPGEFLMGATDEEIAGPLEFFKQAESSDKNFAKGGIRELNSQRPQHRVRITRPFYLGKYEVTQAQWQSVMGSNPSKFTTSPEHPVEQVNWDDIQPFLANLNDRSSTEKMTFTLPTEAQWEYACRAGTTTRYHSGNDPDDLTLYAWHIKTSKETTQPVGRLKPNAFGLFDINGNVWEWCADRCAVDYYAKSPTDDPPGPAEGDAGVLPEMRVMRGASNFNPNPISKYRAASKQFGHRRHWRSLAHGFRVALKIPTAKLKPAVTSTTDPAAANAKYALHFNGREDQVKVPEIPFNGQAPLTIEVWLRPQKDEQRWNGFPTAYPIRFGGRQDSRQLGIYLSGGPRKPMSPIFREKRKTGKNFAGAFFKPHFGKWNHVAAVWYDEKVQIYHNGQRRGELAVGTNQMEALNHCMLWLGHVESTGPIGFHGEMREVRISTTARYTKDFEPQQRHDSDKDTLALYHFDEGNGDVLKDSSGNNHHGKIDGAKWVKLDGPDVSAGPATPDRKAAKWVLSTGGQVTTRIAPNKSITTANDLPEKPFQVHRIDFTGNKQLTDADLAQLKNLAELKDLILMNTAVTDSGIDQIKGFTNLSWLALGGCQITDTGVKQLKSLTNLEMLFLARTPISDQALQHLNALPNLSVLNLSGTKINGTGLAHLASNSNLTSLELSECTNIADAALGPIRQIKSLENLNVTGTNVTAAGVADLQKALPKCEITWDGSAVKSK